MKVMEPLRAEHRELLPHVDALRTAADAVVEAPADALPGLLDEQLAFLRGHLVPHAHAEDVALYPVVEDVMEAPGATATMTRDHVEVLRLVEELVAVRASLGSGDPSPELRRRAQRLLDGLHALVQLHFAKEEELYVPVLERNLSSARAHRLFEDMERAARSRRDAGGQES